MRFFLPLFLICLAFMPLSAQAQNYTSLGIAANQSNAVRGASFDIALTQTIADGWHTYWVNPGDAGEGISIHWDVPKGVTVSNLNFPTPQKISYEGLTDYGYKNQAIYTATVTVDDRFEEDSIDVEGRALMLVCNDICIPEEADISLSIPVESRTPMPVNQSIFDAAQLAMPMSAGWPIEISQTDMDTVLTIQPPVELHNQFTDITVFPHDWGLFDNGDQAMADINDQYVTITQAKGDRSLLELAKTSFIIHTTNGAYVVTGEPSIDVGFGAAFDNSLLFIMVMAFIGGMILNLMPCVFPVLSMKAFSLIKMSGYERRHAQISGLAYTAGIITSLILVAGLLIVLKDAGARIGWGFQLQNPIVILVLFVLFVAISLNLIGVFNVGGRFASIGSKMTSGHDVKASFFTGVLAMIVATPCTAPFMATAIGFALTQNAFVSLMIFATLGLGLAFPYLLLCYIPQTQKILPKPGQWMEVFKKILAIPMMVSAVWLLWVFAQQTNMIGGGDENFGTTPFTRAGLTDILNDNPDSPVFVNMTAAWCITCLVNEKTSLSADSVKQAFSAANVIYVKGDWTNRDDDIAAYLNEFKRDGVPLYVYYPPADAKGMRGDATVLPQVLTPSTITNIIKQENIL